MWKIFSRNSNDEYYKLVIYGEDKKTIIQEVYFSHSKKYGLSVAGFKDLKISETEFSKVPSLEKITLDDFIKRFK